MGEALHVWEISVHSQLALIVCVCSVMSKSLQLHELQPTRLFCPWDFTGKYTGVGCHFLLHGIFLKRGLNPQILHCRWILHHCAAWEPTSQFCCKLKTARKKNNARMLLMEYWTLMMKCSYQIERKIERKFVGNKVLNPVVRAQLLQLCPTLCDPMDHSLPGSSVHRVFQAKILEWVVISFSYSQKNTQAFLLSPFTNKIMRGRRVLAEVYTL